MASAPRPAEVCELVSTGSTEESRPEPVEGTNFLTICSSRSKPSVVIGFNHKSTLNQKVRVKNSPLS